MLSLDAFSRYIYSLMRDELKEALDDPTPLLLKYEVTLEEATVLITQAYITALEEALDYYEGT